MSFRLEEIRVLDIGRHPVSLDRPIGDGEDCTFGEFIEDSACDNPVKNANNDILREKIEGFIAAIDRILAGRMVGRGVVDLSA